MPDVPEQLKHAIARYLSFAKWKSVWLTLRAGLASTKCAPTKTLVVGDKSVFTVKFCICV